MPGGLQLQLLPDIVHDSKLETQIFNTYTQHVFYVSGPSSRERHVRKEERWMRVRPLGQGAYGTVYLERCEQGSDTTKLRAVKEIRKLVSDVNKIEYTRELEAIAKFSHPKYSHCFVRSDGWFENDHSVFITMEYLEHGNLLRYLTSPLPELEVRNVTSQVLEGLKFMHGNGFVHRDLKPGNIMVVTPGPEWFVKIADFGTSKRRQQDVTSLHTLQRGTLGFGAPEAIGVLPDSESKSYISAVDMWSLGAVVYRMLANTTPFPTYLHILHYIDGKAGFPLESLQVQSVTKESQDFIISLMSPNPMDRPTSISADRHPWMTMSLPLAVDNTRASSDTETPTASVGSNSNTGHTSDHVEKALVPQAEMSTDERIVNLGEETPQDRIPSSYRAPYVEDCDDEYEEAHRRSLPLDSPHVLDETGAYPSPIFKGLYSDSPPTPPSDYNETTPSPHPKKVPSLSLNVPETGSLPQDFGPRVRTPYSIRKNEKTNIFGEIKPCRSKSMGEGEERPKVYDLEGLEPPSQHHRSNSAGEASRPPSPPRPDEVNTAGFMKGNSSKRRDPYITPERQDYRYDMYSDSDDTIPGHRSGYESLLLDNEVKNHRDALSMGIARFRDANQKMLLVKQGYRTMHCQYCAAEDNPVDGMIEHVECGHWICHYCLMERFALALVSKDYKLRCCGIDIYLQSFGRILVDPEINRLWTTGYVRKDTKPGPDDDFIMSLYNKAVFRNPQIIEQIQLVTGLSSKDATPNRDPRRRQMRNGA